MTAAGAAQAPSFDADAAVARFRWLEGGEYQRHVHGQPEPRLDDVALCRGALASASDAARSHACLALEILAREPFFAQLPAGERSGLATALLAAAASSHADTAEWSVRALHAMVDRDL